jgi:hypothetical protein
MTFTDVVVLVSVGQIVLGKLQNNGDKDEELLYDVFCDVPLELFNLPAVLVDDSRLCAFQLRDEFEDIVHFNIISQTWEELDRAEWSVAVVVTMFQVSSVLELLLCR